MLNGGLSKWSSSAGHCQVQCAACTEWTILLSLEYAYHAVWGLINVHVASELVHCVNVYIFYNQTS